MAGLDGAAVAFLLDRQLVGERPVGLLPAVGEQRAARRARLGRRRERGAGPGGPTAARRVTVPASSSPPSLISSRPNSKNCASVTYCSGMSRPSIQAIGARVALWCACQFQPACGRKSPRRIATGSPPTTVQTPSPSSTKRNACWVCRCSGAFSPGSRYWIAAHSVGVANGRPPRPGFARAIARRSPPRPTGTSWPACAASARRLSQRHRYGSAFDRGCSGIRSPISVHSGISSSFSKPRYKSSSAGVTAGWFSAATAFRWTGDSKSSVVMGLSLTALPRRRTKDSAIQNDGQPAARGRKAANGLVTTSSRSAKR